MIPRQVVAWWEQFLDIWGTYSDLSFAEQVLFGITLWCSTFAIVLGVRIVHYLLVLWW